MAASTQTVRIRRRPLGDPGGPGAPGALALAEPGYNANGDTLHIGNGTSVQLLVGADRQIEMTGTQTVPTGAGNAKTWDVTNFRLLGGTSGNVLTRGATAGDVAWAAAPPSVVIADDLSIEGDGTAGDMLRTIRATNAEVLTGTDTNKAVTPASLAHVTGNVSTLNVALGATNLTTAINNVLTQVLALSAAIVWIGSYDLVNVTPGAGSPFPGAPTPGPLPTAAAGNRGWTVILTAAGPGVAPAPPGPLAVGDWLISDGTGWIHIPLHHPATAAANVTVTTIGTAPNQMTSTNVQDALAELHATSLTALTTVHVDGTSVTGLTGAAGAGLTAANALRVGEIDGGTF